MLRLIERALPAPVHCVALRIAYRLRHRWRQLRRTPIAGVNVIVTDLQGAVLLLRHSYGPDHWHLPGGGIDRSESPEDAARRELAEELAIEVGRLKEIGRLEGEISGSPHTLYVFTVTTDRRPRPDRREVIEARLFPSHSLPYPMAESARRALELARDCAKGS